MENAFKIQTWLADYLRTELQTLGSSAVVSEFEPGERGHYFLDSGTDQTIYVYLDRTNFEDSQASQFDPQQHGPFYNFDIYVATKALDNAGAFTSSIERTHRVMEVLSSTVYTILMNQTVKMALEDDLGFLIEKFFFKTCEKGGILERPESKRAAIVFRMTMSVSVQERNTGYDGIDLDLIVDEITTNEVT